MNNIKYRHNGNVTPYGTNTNTLSTSNSKEYEYFLTLMGLMKGTLQANAPHLFGENAQGLLNGALFGEKPPYLLEEKSPENFPDFTLLRENCVTIVDCFEIDASKGIVKNDKSKGSELEQLMGRARKTNLIQSAFEIEAMYEEAGIIFSTQNLVDNLMRMLNKKISKVDNYKEAVNWHFQKEGDYEALEIAHKCTNVWFMILDKTPTTLFPFIFATPLKFLADHEELQGVIYIHISDPLKNLFTLEDVAFVINDKKARKDLGNIHQQLM